MFKKILFSTILVSLLGLNFPAVNAQTAGEPVSAGIKTAQQSAGAAKDVAMEGLASAMTPFIINCVPATYGEIAGALTAVEGVIWSEPSTPAMGGICEIAALQGQMFVLSNAKQTVKEKFDFGVWLEEFAWNMARLVLKNLILDRLVDALITWIDNNGQGAIISDWQEFFQQAGENAAGGVAKLLGMGFLCSNFDLNLRIALAPSPKFSQRMTCSLNDIVGNIDSFMENFTNGNWIGYQELWQPKNNFYGGVIMGLEEITLQKAAAKDAAQSEAIAGNGFLSFKNCDKNGNCSTYMPGAMVAEAAKVAGIRSPFDRIVSSSDMDMYITAIADAGIKKLVKMGVSGLKGLSDTKTADQASKDPCSGLTGQTYVACTGAQKAQSSYFASKKEILASYSADALYGRQALQDVLIQSIAVQDDLVSKLNRLAQCGKTDTAAELAVEQETLNYLQSKYNDNQVFIDQIIEANEKVSSTEENNWTDLADSADTQFIGDEYSSLNETNFAKDELERLQANADKKLPAIENALTSCPTITQ